MEEELYPDISLEQAEADVKRFEKELITKYSGWAAYQMTQDERKKYNKLRSIESYKRDIEKGRY